MKENCELAHWVIKGIEEDIISSFLLNPIDYEKDKCLLTLRRNIINEMVLSHQKDIIDAIREFIPNFEHEEKGKNLDQKM